MYKLIMANETEIKIIKNYSSFKNCINYLINNNLLKDNRCTVNTKTGCYTFKNTTDNNYYYIKLS